MIFGRAIATDPFIGTLVTAGGDTAMEETRAGESGLSDCEARDQILVVPLLGETEKITLV